MTFFFYAILSVIAIGLHTSGAAYFSDWISGRPSAPLLISVFLGRHRSRQAGTIGGFFLGFFEDVIAGGLLGLNALINGLVGYYAGTLKGPMKTGMGRHLCAVVFFASLFGVLCSTALVKFFLPGQSLPAGYWLNAGKTLALNVALAPLLIGLLAWLERRMLSPALDIPYRER